MRDTEINEETKIRLGIVGVCFAGIASAFIWVGTIQADINHIKKEQDEWKSDIKEIKESVSDIKADVRLMRKR